MMRTLTTCLWITLAALTGFALCPRDGRGEEKETTEEKTPDYERQDFSVKVGDRQFVATVLSPPQNKLARHPALLLKFTSDRNTALFTSPYCLVPRAFLEHGHRVVSFDIPCHGDRIGRFGGSIPGLRNSFVAGVDPFAMFVEDGRSVISECIRRGWATSGRIAVEGPSRAGYMVLRLLAADERIAVAAGMAPVTDWRLLREFVSARDRKDVASIRLTHFVEKMAGRHVYLAIGKTDERVGTAACQELYHALKKAQVDAGYDASCVEFVLTDDPGHSINSAYQQGIDFLLKWSDER
ncbi:MAG: prolyl oligopeptidase family serine peptidase [Pirellulaceae bacterium]|nr:prolyl oligopeptidase family serine peptidase [Pirellulaceae bacterium]